MGSVTLSMFNGDFIKIVSFQNFRMFTQLSSACGDLNENSIIFLRENTPDKVNQTNNVHSFVATASLFLTLCLIIDREHEWTIILNPINVLVWFCAAPLSGNLSEGERGWQSDDHWTGKQFWTFSWRRSETRSKPFTT